MKLEGINAVRADKPVRMPCWFRVIRVIRGYPFFDSVSALSLPLIREN